MEAADGGRACRLVRQGADCGSSALGENTAGQLSLGDDFTARLAPAEPQSPQISVTRRDDGSDKMAPRSDGHQFRMSHQQQARLTNSGLSRSVNGWR